MTRRAFCFASVFRFLWPVMLRLVHINGNAVYNVEHPWTLQLLTHLEDPSFEIDSTLQWQSN